MSARLEIKTLGGLSVRVAGEPVTAFSTRKVEALLVYLACNRGKHSRDVLATLLWEEKSQDQALASLRAALSNLRKHLKPFIQATRSQIGIEPQANIWLDVEELQRHIEAGDIAAAATLYEGDFLHGFFIRGSSSFEHWVTGEREHYRRLVQEALSISVDQALGSGQYSFGISQAQRLLAIDPLDESAQRRLMSLLALNGQRSQAIKQYQAFQELLWENLAVEPEEATKRLYTQIQAGELSAPIKVETTYDPTEVRLPKFLSETVQAQIVERPFVNREAELDRLNDYLNQANTGVGSVVFVTGSAGQGKTTLMREFVLRSLEVYPNLLAINGSSNAYFGSGEPYLPFREAMAMLTGDIESAWKAGLLTHEHATRLWTALPQVITALLNYGRNLLGIFVPAGPLLARAKSAIPAQAARIQELQHTINQIREIPENLEQSHFFEQVTNVFRKVSETYTLLIILDDLQWADSASLSLLFHLAKRIQGNPIMLLCAYRSQEVALGRGGERHPLEKISFELQRSFGEIHVDLTTTTETEGRAFIDAFLDTEPNQLGDKFRKTLYERTGGHPLFTVELLRSMQESGALVREGGKWTASQTVDWGILPIQVEAVIEERIGRLARNLREILAIASVEGMDFTAQVVARIRDSTERNLIHQLSEELSKKHRLISEQGVHQAGGNRLHLYRFRHILFQQHLYNGMGSSELEILHRDVAASLEMLYSEQVDEIAPQLAFHYLNAGYKEKAQNYLAVAGHRAQLTYANREAIEYYSQSLDLAPKDDLQSRYELLLSREKAFDQLGARKDQVHDLETLHEIAEELGEASKKAEVALRQSNFAELTTDYIAAIEASQRAIELAAEAEDIKIGVEGLLAWGLALVRQSNYEEARVRIEEALKKSKGEDLPDMYSRGLALLGILEYEQGNYRAAIKHHKEAIEIFRVVGDQIREAFSLNTIGNANHKIRDYPNEAKHLEQALVLFRHVGNILGESFGLNNLGQLATSQGDYVRAQSFYEQAQKNFEQIEHQLGSCSVLINLGEIANFQGDYALGREYYSQALELSKEVGSPLVEAYALAGLGDSQMILGQLDEAADSFSRAIKIREEMGQTDFVMEARAGLARVYKENGAMADAKSQVDGILKYLNAGYDVMATNAPMLIYLTCFQVLSDLGDSRANEVLETAYLLLQEQAGQIADESSRQSFLENISWHKEIVALYEQSNN